MNTEQTRSMLKQEFDVVNDIGRDIELRCRTPSPHRRLRAGSVPLQRRGPRKYTRNDMPDTVPFPLVQPTLMLAHLNTQSAVYCTVRVATRSSISSQISDLEVDVPHPISLGKPSPTCGSESSPVLSKVVYLHATLFTVLYFRRQILSHDKI